MAILYISPKGSGTHSGSSAANAGTIYDLPKFIHKAGPGGEVRLLADKGTYYVKKEIILNSGGAAGAPVKIHGVSSSGAPLHASFAGTRAANWKPGMFEGHELFRLIGGANHLKFADISAKNFGNGVFRIAANISDLSITGIAATNVMRFVETYSSWPATSASVSGLKVENSTVSDYSKNAIRLQYNSHNISINNVVGDSMKENGGLIIAGVSLSGTTHDVTFNHVTMKNNYGHGTTGQYWNGDGFVAEHSTYNIKFIDTVASGNTDAGYDIKAHNVTFLRAHSTNNNRSYRLWGTGVTMTDSVSTNPKHYGGTGKTTHVWVADGASVALNNFKHTDTANHLVFDLSKGSNVLKLVGTAKPAASLMQLGYHSVINPSGGLYAKATVNGITSSTIHGTTNSTINGTTSADVLAGGSGNDTLAGGKGNDTYVVNATGDKPLEQGGEGVDLVKTTLGSYSLGKYIENLAYVGSGNFVGTGNDSNNSITGGSGNDRLTGGTGNDTLKGGGGADTYVFRLGDKKDTIYNADSGGTDTLLFGSGIGQDDLWLAHNGNDLLATVRGTGGTDSVRVKNWYTDSTTHLNLKLSDGSVLAASQVQSLVQAMAAFTSSSGAPLNLSNAQEQKVDTTIAANWKPA